MDLGKIMIGIALVMLSAGMLISPAAAIACDHSCTVGCGSICFPADAPVAPYSPAGRENPAVHSGKDTRYESAMTPMSPIHRYILSGKRHAPV